MTGSEFDNNGPVNLAATGPRKNKRRLILVRHGTSVANEVMDRPSNRWGDATFRDDPSLRDSPLSEEGIRQAEALRNRWPDILADHGGGLAVDLVVVSPLTRALQTFEVAVRPHLPAESKVEVVAHPLATERVYTSSDLGRSASELRAEFPGVGFDDRAFPGSGDGWWFVLPGGAPYDEWRPHGRGQYYAVPGEPEGAFEDRMRKLRGWLASREEWTVVLVTHWGVIRWLSGKEFANCEARVVGFGDE